MPCRYRERSVAAHRAAGAPGTEVQMGQLVGESQVTELSHLLVRREPPRATITLNRPEKRNVLSLELMRELMETLLELGADPAVRAIVIEGAGPAFSAGHDLSEMIGRDRGLLPGALRRLRRADGDDPPGAPAGDRQGSQGRHSGRLPARRRLRSRRGLRRGSLRDAQESRSASSAPHRWCPCLARSAASAPSSCSSPASR